MSREKEEFLPAYLERFRKGTHDAFSQNMFTLGQDLLSEGLDDEIVRSILEQLRRDIGLTVESYIGELEQARRIQDTRGTRRKSEIALKVAEALRQIPRMQNKSPSIYDDKGKVSAVLRAYPDGKEFSTEDVAEDANLRRGRVGHILGQNKMVYGIERIGEGRWKKVEGFQYVERGNILKEDPEKARTAIYDAISSHGESLDETGLSKQLKAMGYTTKGLARLLDVRGREWGIRSERCAHHTFYSISSN